MPEQLPPDSSLHRDGKRLYMEGVRLDKVAHEAGTPVYVYSRAAIEDSWRRCDAAFGTRSHLVCYAVKACSNLAVLSLLSRLGSGFDIVSLGELTRVLKAGCDPQKVFFSGVGKRADEIEQALLAGIACFNVESASELDVLARQASLTGCRASVAIRINPDVDADTHPHITTGRYCDKFGVTAAQAIELYEQIRKHPLLEARGVDCHIGSQIKDPAIYAAAVAQVTDFADRLCADGHAIEHIDVGGGFAIAYDDEQVVPAEDHIKAIVAAAGARPYRIVIEPGRVIVGEAGVLVTEVLYIKNMPQKNFAVVDAAMNDLLRPVLYQAHHGIVPLETRNGEAVTYDIVGPVCESGDTFATDRDMVLGEGQQLAILSAGAYGFSMAGGYNSRPRAAEVMVDGDDWHIIRLRESIADLMDGECTLPDSDAIDS